MVAGALVGPGGGKSLSQGSAGPARSGIRSDNLFTIGGNRGIGSNQGISSTLFLILAAVIAVVFIVRTR